MEFNTAGESGTLNKMRIFSGNSNVSLAQMICEHLGIPLGRAQVKKFSDGEINVEINESVRGMDVFVVQSTCPPVNDHLMEALILIDALKRASAARINAVIPYYGYAR
ncbi:MAG: ribose-phosphate pyrophosphokinase-like domain-containing protein, partial [Thermodesulfobacteriota bacterium]